MDEQSQDNRDRQYDKIKKPTKRELEVVIETK